MTNRQIFMFHIAIEVLPDLPLDETSKDTLHEVVEDLVKQAIAQNEKGDPIVEKMKFLAIGKGPYPTPDPDMPF